MRRRSLHRALAEALEAAGAPSREVAKHWLGARAGAQAREALLRAAAESEAVHAHRDAAAADRQALDLWPESGDEAAPRRGARALRALLAAGRRAGRGHARVARARRAALRRGRRARAGAGAAGARGGVRAQGRPRGGVRRAPVGRRGLRRQRPPGRGGGRAAGDGQPAPPGRAARGGDRAGAGRARRGRGGGPPRSADPRRRARRARTRQARRLRGRAGDGARRPRAGARARPDRGRRRALPAAQRHALRLGRLPPRRGGARHGAPALPRQPGRRHGGGVRDVHGLRAARARRLVARRRDVPRADRRAHRRVRRRGAARRDPRVRGQAELGAPAAHLLARHRRRACATTT